MSAQLVQELTDAGHLLSTHACHQQHRGPERRLLPRLWLVAKDVHVVLQRHRRVHTKRIVTVALRCASSRRGRRRPVSCLLLLDPARGGGARRLSRPFTVTHAGAAAAAAPCVTTRPQRHGLQVKPRRAARPGEAGCRRGGVSGAAATRRVGRSAKGLQRGQRR